MNINHQTKHFQSFCSAPTQCTARSGSITTRAILAFTLNRAHSTKPLSRRCMVDIAKLMASQSRSGCWVSNKERCSSQSHVYFVSALFESLEQRHLSTRENQVQILEHGRPVTLIDLLSPSWSSLFRLDLDDLMLDTKPKYWVLDCRINDMSCRTLWKITKTTSGACLELG